MKKETCNECNGSGKFDAGLEVLKNGLKIESFFDCPKCKGAGEVDWVEQIVGKPVDTIGIGWYPCDGLESLVILKGMFDEK